MKAQIIYDPKYGYTIHIPDVGIITEWDTFEELVKNLQEAIDLINEDRKEKISIDNLRFNLKIEDNASILQAVA